MKLISLLPATLLLSGTMGTVVLSLPLSPQILAQRTRSDSPTPQNQQQQPTGGLFVQSKDGKQQVFPLKHTEVKAKVSGNVSRVEVTQTFENPFSDPLEAIYVFPLPDEAAVDDMEIKIGDRIIKGNIKKREEAQEIYDRARREGRTAGLLEQERDNIFTQSLANIKPGEKIDVTIRYTDSLKFEGGNYEFVFPMVVGPRYIPGNPIPPTPLNKGGEGRNTPLNKGGEGRNTPLNKGGEGGIDTDRVPDASRITPPVLRPGTRSGHDINVTVEIDAGVPISEVNSTSHKITTSRQINVVKVQLANEDTIPNKDLILRYRIAGNNTQATVLTQSDEKGGHFAVYLIPALQYRRDEIVPKDVVFLMDTSGSQSGEPLAKSKELMRRFINGLNPNDTFTIIDFANTTQQLSPTPLANTAENRSKAMAYIDRLDARGGTELLNGIRAVLNFPPASSGRLRSVVLLTDGYIGNENEVIAEVQRNLKPGNRLYGFGVGSSINRFLINRLAEVGRGTAQVIRQDEPTQEVAEKFFRKINNPVLTNIQVSWQGGGETATIYPLAAPDLFANQPLVLFGKKRDKINGNLRIVGVAAGGKRYEKMLPVNFNSTGNLAIAQLWGRARIKDLMNQMFGGETKSGVDAVTETALSYRLLSQYTAFVAVSEEVRVNPDGTRQRVEVPVELPEGVSYEGIFGREEGVSPGSNLPLAASPSRRTSGGVLSQDFSTTNRVQGQTTFPQSPPPPPPPPPPVRGLDGDVTQNTSRIEVISADGLDANAIASITQKLQNVNIPQNISGEIVLELSLQNGRVRRIIFDDKASTVKEQKVIDEIRRSLLTWQAPQSINNTIRLRLRIRN
ncbi:after-VIT domain-containing protein [Phormidium sp. LEGE 05292]|uniref:VIT domain-containing protein n=1 Tax=[Phormidium] sp. LEGE 05292 TaxID=767427 RepID=UPI001880ABBD|nr:VIT domain-containing protein [Phormidium sp. LEGE 05292]MBE9225191.1 after-VIT domain-containing protein [Phormidium sp. LEGE 05292]